MGDLQPGRKRWSLTQEAFDALLERLGPDRDTAGARFEVLRRKLVQFFSYEGCAFPERWADESLDRVAKRLAEGSAVDEIETFTRGVARMVLREARTAETRERNLKGFPEPSPSSNEEDAKCLETCIQKLTPGMRELVEQYYLGSAESRIEARKAIAEKMGINMEALRSRALRARRQLESCLGECRERHGSDDTNF